MISFRNVVLALVSAGLLLILPSAASAQQSVAMLEIEGDFAMPLTAPTRDRFLPGGGGSIAALLVPLNFMLPTLRLRGIVLGDGPAPQDPRFVDPGLGTLYTLTAGLRLRTDGLGQALPEPEATGFWIEIDLGGALTGNLLRPAFEAAAGFLWDAGNTEHAGHVDIGPVVRFVDVLQTEESGVDANSTYVLTLGLDIVLFDAAPTFQETRVIQTRQPPAHHHIEGEDADGDGIDDSDDACRTEAEDFDGVRDLDGCPDPDDDADGIPDVSDECPRDEEDLDGFQDADGCPESDNDGDGYVDRFDTCPDEAETQNGIDDADGCPEVEEPVPSPDLPPDFAPELPPDAPIDPPTEAAVPEEPVAHEVSP